MKNIFKNIIWLFLAMLVLLPACEDKEWSEDYDIPWPVSKISELSTNEAEIEDVVSITGTNMDNVNEVLVGSTSCDILEEESSETQLTFQLPRRVETGEVSVRNEYDRDFVYEDAILRITYPKTEVTKWPEAITAGESFDIEGENVDLINTVVVDGEEVDIRRGDDTGSISVSTEGLPLEIESTITISVTALGGIEGDAETTDVLVEEPSDVFEPVEPVVLWTFEDGDPVTEAADVSPDEAGRNLGGLTAPRGDNYYSVYKDQTGGWTNFMYIVKEGPFDLAEFHEPHITMLVNTNGKKGYINPFMTQDGEELDNHLTNGNANEEMKYGDDYMIETEGWEWRSYPVSKLFPDFDPTGEFEEISMRFTSGNVGNGDNPEDFEIHVDQIMITDGLQKPVVNVFDFEGGAPDWEDGGAGVSAGEVISTEPTGGYDQYYHLSFTSPGDWAWTGAIGYYEEIDLSEIKEPYISFMVNTNGERGYFQMETYQNDVKWGGNIPNTYEITTDGWEVMTFPISDILGGNWGGDGDASELDTNAPIDYLKIGFTTGNIEEGAQFELNIDEVYISDGGMW
ncbi:MAG: IPT/TIG domain-containing protein [Bacteroidota bacterium]